MGYQNESKGRVKMNILGAIRALPELIGIIKSIENEFPAGTGVQKIEMAIDILKTVFGDIQKIEVQLRAIISIVVKYFNAVGVFKKRE